jgi:hypothetical protein
MPTRIRKQWLDLTNSPTGLTADDINYTNTATIKQVITNLYGISDTYQTLTITKSGTGTGTITSDPSGIDCGSTCSYQFLFGTSVILTATPDSGSAFGGWFGDTVGINTTTTVIMDSNKNVTATFNELYSLTVTKSGTGTGTVTSNPSGINCGSTCAYQFSAGTSVTLTATPDSISAFGGWSGDVTGSSSIVIITMDSNKSVTAIFNPKYTLTITKSGAGTGTVTSSPSGINCGSTCSYQFVSGTNVTLTATPDSGSTFGGWSGDITGSSSTIIVTIDSNKSVIATFNLGYTLTVTKSGTGTGTVTSSPSGINCGSTCSYLFAPSTNVTLTATPDPSFAFGGWSGDIVDTNAVTTVTMSANKNVTATFNIDTSAGYFAGGYDASVIYNFIDKLLFRNESRSTLTATLSRSVYAPSACNSSLSGYFTGGYNSSGYQSFIDKLLFSNETRSTLTSTLSHTTGYQSACNSSLSGYFAGGSGSFIDKLLFSNESRSTLATTLSQSVYAQAACNSTLAGYFADGYSSSYQSFIDKLLFSNESRTTLTATLSRTVYELSACNSTLVGYFSGGYNSSLYNFIDKLLFSNESRSTLTATLSQSVGWHSACNSSLAGYFAGGWNSNGYQSFIDKLLFSNETRSTLTVTLSRTIGYQAACQSGGIV